MCLHSIGPSLRKPSNGMLADRGTGMSCDNAAHLTSRGGTVLAKRGVALTKVNADSGMRGIQNAYAAS
eukprot:15461261-Alexandrium_andersonii.AAC.1